MTILLWGRSDEAVVSAVAQACDALGTEAVAVDGEGITSVSIDGDLVTDDGRHVPLRRVTGLLVRPEGQLTSRPAVRAYQALAAWAELTPAVVLNRPAAAASNCSKPYQLGLISSAGFAVPDTLVTTDPDDVRAFWSHHGNVVYKSVSGVRSIVAVLGDDDDARLDDVTVAPTQFQQHIAGVDHRVHVVGHETFACRIKSTAVDYRYAACSGESTILEAVRLPADVTDRCIGLAKALDLGLAGIDLRLDQDGVWWCFEVNTAPGFIWFEQQTGLPIAMAVARTLAEQRTTAPRPATRGGRGDNGLR
jgi:glutathione synthase/RimK-type ligase-like ATP-grasp enzyme